MRIPGSFTAIAALSFALAGPALADDRLVTHPYDPDEIVRIDGALGVQATIGFGEEERIENVAVGDSAKWQITPNKRANLLFVKPLEAGARTNMTVVTDRHTYFFDLVVSPRGKPIYMLRFTYADEPEDAPQVAAADSAPAPEPLAALNADERAVVTGDPVAAPADAAVLNFAWERRGDTALMPARIYDDGEATYLTWSAQKSVPAILIRNDAGEEGPVNYAVRGDTIVIDAVPGLIILRAGKDSATLKNLRTGDSRGAGRRAAGDGDSASTHQPASPPAALSRR